MQLTHFIVIFGLYWSSTTADNVNVIRSSYSSSNAGPLAPRQGVCDPGYFPCSDGGCCADGTTCATVEGAQVCQSTTGGCLAPPVPCGVACCNAGSTCVIQGNQFRCQLPGDGTPALTAIPAPTFAPAPATAPSPVPVTVPAPSPITLPSTTDFFGATTASGTPSTTNTQLFATTTKASSLASTEHLSIILASIAAVVAIGFIVFGH